MRNLGLTVGTETSLEDFDRYIKIFMDGLLEEQAMMITGLYMNYVPPPDSVEEVVQ
jgi:hypothetical protein